MIIIHPTWKLHTWGSKVGKNRQFIANTLVASTCKKCLVKRVSTTWTLELQQKHFEAKIISVSFSNEHFYQNDLQKECQEGFLYHKYQYYYQGKPNHINPSKQNLFYPDRSKASLSILDKAGVSVPGFQQSHQNNPLFLHD